MRRNWLYVLLGFAFGLCLDLISLICFQTDVLGVHQKQSAEICAPLGRSASPRSVHDVLRARIVETFGLSGPRLNSLDVALSGTPNAEAAKFSALLDKFCPSKARCELEPPFVEAGSPYRIARRLNLSVCTILKNMSTLMAAIVCYLHDPARMLRSKYSFFEQWDRRRACLRTNEAATLQQAARRIGPGASPLTMRKLSLIRDPLEKFFSGYTNQCYTQRKCGACTEIGCLLDTIIEHSRDRRLYNKFGGSGSTRSHINAHFFPQNWRCEFDTLLDEYTLIRYNSSDIDSLLYDLGTYFRKIGVDENSINFINDKLRSGKTSHATAGRSELATAQRELATNPELSAKFIRIFYFDYLILQYPLPDFVINLY